MTKFAPTLKTGDTVAYIERSLVGTVLSVNRDRLSVEFPDGNYDWGILSDLKPLGKESQMIRMGSAVTVVSSDVFEDSSVGKVGICRGCRVRVDLGKHGLNNFYESDLTHWAPEPEAPVCEVIDG